MTNSILDSTTKLTNLIISPLTDNINFRGASMTTVQRDALVTANILPGTTIYNSTVGLNQSYISNSWQSISVGGAGIFTAPNLAAAPGTPVQGQIYEDTVTNQITAYNGAAWGALYRTTNLGGVFGVTQRANSGVLPAAQASGTIVAQTDINLLKHYNGTGYATLFQMVSAATGVGLTNLAAGDSPFTKPTGTSAAVEVAANQINGFGYYNTTATNLRSYSNSAWTTLMTTTNTATGVGLTAGNTPFVLPNGTRAAVEVAGNQVTGFEYWDTTNNVKRLRTNAAWVTVTTS